MNTSSKSFQAAADRRTFLKAVGGAALVPAALSAVAHASGDETLKVALIGCGGRGTGAAAQALGTKGPVKLWAMADAFEDRLQASLKGLTAGLANRYDVEASKGFGQRVDVPPQRRFVGLDAYRKAIDSGVDLVILTSPPGFRPRHFEYAIHAGKHVFMEKPVASDAPGIRQILATAEQAKRKKLKVGVGLQRHHQQSYQEALRQLDEGVIGDIITMRCYWNTAAPAKTPPRREGLTELEYQVRNWYFFAWLSGDHIVEQHIHNIDVCNWIKSAYPVEAQGQGGRQVRTGKEYGHIFDHHSVEFTYADGTKMFSQCRQIPGCWRQVAEYAHGTKGTAELGSVSCAIRLGNEEIWRSARGRGSRKVNPYQTEHDVLFDAVRNDKPHNEAEYGARSTMTAILGRLATYSGKVVTWDEALNSDIRLTTDAEEWGAEPPILADKDGHYPVALPGVTKVV